MMMRSILPLACSLFATFTTSIASGKTRAELGLRQIISEATDASNVEKYSRNKESIDREVEQLGDRHLSCQALKTNADQILKNTVTPNAILTALAASRPQILLLGESHTPEDFIKWESDTLAFYRKLNPDVDCVFRESQLNYREAQAILSIQSYFAKTRNLDRAMDLFAQDMGLPMKKFLNENKESEAFLLGQAVGFQMYGEGSFVPMVGATVRREDLMEAAVNHLKNVSVDMRHLGYDRETFMSHVMSGLIQRGLCHSAVGIFGRAHLAPLKKLLAQANVSSASIGLFQLNASETNYSYTGMKSTKVRSAGFFEYPTCPEKVILPTRHFGYFPSNEDNLFANSEAAEGTNPVSLNQFNAIIVAPVVPVLGDLSNIKDADDLYH